MMNTLFKINLGFIFGMLIAVALSSPLLPGQLTTEGEEIRQRVFEILPIGLGTFFVMSIAVFQQQWIPFVRGLGKKLPSWMTKEI